MQLLRVSRVENQWGDDLTTMLLEPLSERGHVSGGMRRDADRSRGGDDGVRQGTGFRGAANARRPPLMPVDGSALMRE
jgi:hypothetical protein